MLRSGAKHIATAFGIGNGLLQGLLVWFWDGDLGQGECGLITSLESIQLAWFLGV